MAIFATCKACEHSRDDAFACALHPGCCFGKFRRNLANRHAAIREARKAYQATGRTRNLDRLANQGTLFIARYASLPVCSPPRAGLLTGQFPVRYRMHYALRSLEENARPPCWPPGGPVGVAVCHARRTTPTGTTAHARCSAGGPRVIAPPKACYPR